MEITATAAAKGPGSFTGLRIGLATAKTAAYIWKVPLIGVDTLEALVWNLVGARAFILPLLDAQRGNVYAAMYGSFDEIWQEAPAEAASIDEVVKAAMDTGGTTPELLCPCLFSGDGRICPMGKRTN